MEHIITIANSTFYHSPSANIIIIPSWGYTPYRHSKFIDSPYTHHLYAFPNDANTFLPSDQHTGTLTPTSFGDIYLIIATHLALSFQPSHTAMTALHNILESIYDIHLPTPSISTLPMSLCATYTP
jgi:hypothetical protein